MNTPTNMSWTGAYVKNYALPAALKNFLKKSRIIETENGIYTLTPWKEMHMITLLINPQAISNKRKLPYTSHPLSRGYFCVSAYPLVSDSQSFIDPDEILLWLPEHNLFGTYHNDKQQISIYKNCTWLDIESELDQYLMIQKPSTNLAKHLRLSEHFDFIPDNFHTQVVNLLYKNDVGWETLTEAERLTWQYERALLNHPFHADLYCQYLALMHLYKYLASYPLHRTASDVKKWFDKCDAIIKWLRQYMELLE